MKINDERKNIAELVHQYGRAAAIGNGVVQGTADAGLNANDIYRIGDVLFRGLHRPVRGSRNSESAFIVELKNEFTEFAVFFSHLIPAARPDARKNTLFTNAVQDFLDFRTGHLMRHQHADDGIRPGEFTGLRGEFFLLWRTLDWLIRRGFFQRICIRLLAHLIPGRFGGFPLRRIFKRFFGCARIRTRGGLFGRYGRRRRCRTAEQQRAEAQNQQYANCPELRRTTAWFSYGAGLRDETRHPPAHRKSFRNRADFI